ncbi:MAG: flavodoxin domain-containing protein [Gaiellales bacterium]
MKVLVAVASRHGATQEIADRIGARLQLCGLDAVVEPVAQVTSLAGYEAVVLGSAVYVGKWLEPARTFVAEHADELRARRTWLFSSGPLGDPARPEPDKAVDLADVLEQTEAISHRLFSGRLDRSLLGVGERAVARLVKAPEGDFRQLGEIDAWADEIVAACRATVGNV